MIDPTKRNEDRFERILAREHDAIEKRRAVHGLDRLGNPSDTTVGLCLSGGGVRSATFNLGVLQAMHKHGFLPRIDYLSTVSGGGYVGASLSWYLFATGKFPFPRRATSGEEAWPLDWIRRHASYLVPGEGLNTWALVAAALRGVFVNLLIFFPILFGLIFYMSWIPRAYADSFPGWSGYPPAFLLFVLLGLILLGCLALAFIVYALLSRSRPIAFSRHRTYSVQYGSLLRLATFFLVIGLVPFVDRALTGVVNDGRSLATVVSVSLGVVLILVGWVGRRNTSETKGIRAASLGLGLSLAIYSLILWLFHLSLDLWGIQQVMLGEWDIAITVAFVGLMLLSVLLGLSADINHVSLHRYYRDRLLEAYLPNPQVRKPTDELRKKARLKRKEKLARKLKDRIHSAFGRALTDDADDDETNELEAWMADDLRLSELNPSVTGGPYHIINANVTTLGSRQSKYRIRGGDSFVFTPLHVGSMATGGWVDANRYIGGRMDVATAMSISGAAVDPNTGATRSRPLAFIMSLLNVRLGYWLRNPRFPLHFGAFASPLFWHYYALREMLGWRMDENGGYIHVSDGGHFENLGLYELVRRKCAYIIVSDAGADPHWRFADLARAINRIRTDFHVEVEIDTEPLHPDPLTRHSNGPFVIGRVRYDEDRRNDGFLIYLKTTVCPGLAEDIYGYQRAHAEFPDESTTDQFFGDEQFEAYRELGYQLADRMFSDPHLRDHAEFAELFSFCADDQGGASLRQAEVKS